MSYRVHKGGEELIIFLSWWCVPWCWQQEAGGSGRNTENAS